MSNLVIIQSTKFINLNTNGQHGDTSYGFRALLRLYRSAVHLTLLSFSASVMDRICPNKSELATVHTVIRQLAITLCRVHIAFT